MLRTQCLMCRVACDIASSPMPKQVCPTLAKKFGLPWLVWDFRYLWLPSDRMARSSARMGLRMFQLPNSHVARVLAKMGVFLRIA